MTGSIKITKSGEIVEDLGFGETLHNLAAHFFQWVTGTLQDAEFELYAKEDVTVNGVVVYAKDELIDTVKTDASGIAEFDELPAGSYYTVETVPPKGYELPENPRKEFVLYNGFDENKEPVVLCDEDGTVYNAPIQVSIGLIKTDEKTEQPLENAVFGLYAAEKESVFEADDLLAEISTNADGKAVFELLLPVGSYYVRELKAPEGYVIAADVPIAIEEDGEVISNAAVTEDDAGNTVLQIKDTPVEQPEFEKKIQDVNDTTGKTSDWQDSADYDIGDAVPYKLAATLANNVTDYLKYHITFHDEMEKGLTFDAVSKVTLNGEELTEGEDYKLEPAEDKHSFKLRLDWIGEEADGELQRIADTSLNKAVVEVYFTAILNEEAVLGNAGNVNKAYLEYSCNPTVNDDGIPSEETENSPEDFVIAFTYLAEVNKVDQDGKALENAEFKLEKKLKDGTKKEIVLDKKTSTASLFSFKGLDDGSYVLTETKTPEGYKPIDPVEFTVTADHEIEWDVNKAEDAENSRESQLTKLTGDVTTGVLKLDTDPKTGKLTGDVENTYSASGEGEVKVKKNLVGRDWTADDSFEFTIKPVGEAPATEKSTVKVTKDSADYTESFGKVKFTKAGTYQWTVSETHKGETIDGVAYDSADKTITIVVKDDGKGKLVAEDGSAPVGTAQFTNTYTKSGEGKGELKVLKNLVGRDWTADDSFEFTIKPVGDAPAPEKTTVKVTKDSASFTESFGKVTFTKAGTYEWTVSEAHKGETIDGITYDSADKTIKIVVKDDGKGNLIADTGSALIQTAVFTNIYKETLRDVEVTKVWKDDNNRDKVRPKTIEIRLLVNGKESGAKMTLSEANAWKGKFAELPVKDAEGKVIAYGVREIVPTGYAATFTGDMDKGFTVTNTRVRTVPGGPGGSNTSSAGAVRTGDPTNFPLLFGILIAGAAVLAVLLILRKKRNGSEE